jgi:hypothetical protein
MRLDVRPCIAICNAIAQSRAVFDLLMELLVWCGARHGDRWYDVRPLVLMATRRRVYPVSNLERENGKRATSSIYTTMRSDEEEMNARCSMISVAVPLIKAGRRGWDTEEV